MRVPIPPIPIIGKILKKRRAKKESTEYTDPDIYPSKNLVAITDETNIRLQPCEVLEGERVKYRIGKQSKTIKAFRTPHILSMPMKRLFPHKIFRFWAPINQSYRLYTTQKESLITHDPNLDSLDKPELKELKTRFENMILLERHTIKAHIGASILEDLQPSKGWKDHIVPLACLVAIVVVVFITQGGI